MPFFQKKPVVIEARQLTNDNASEILDWINSSSTQRYSFLGELYVDVLTRSVLQPLLIRNLEGDHEATIGDWIIKGVKGEFYPCKPDIFEMTYQPLIKQENNNG